MGAGRDVGVSMGRDVGCGIGGAVATQPPASDRRWFLITLLLILFSTI